MYRSVLLCALVVSVRAAPALMPQPVKLETGSGSLAIDGHFAVQATGYSDARLAAALRRFSARLSRQTGIPFLPNPGAAAALQVDCAAPAAGHAGSPTLEEDESYSLDVTAAGARLRAATVEGALHGLETFSQLVAPAAEGFAAPAVHIEDRPRFPWRGLTLDVSRHWVPLPVILRNLDAMAAVKLNVFHWHLSDDQGFRVESRKYPKLQELGSDGHYYTQDELREAIAYARDRGIRVVPEFDIPGHTTSWLVGYPELAASAGPFSIGRYFGVFDPVLDPTRETTYRFLEGFIGEMAAIFPDPYFHIGGDEVNGKSWKANPRIQEFIREHKLNGQDGLQAYFNQRVSKILTKYHKIMIGWDEVLDPNLPAETVIHSWRGNESLAQAAAKGHRAILSWGYYLNFAQPASYHYGIDPLGGPAAKLPPEEAARILGGEACMWMEYVDANNLDSRVWPRLAAVAERFWSPKDVTDVNSMYARLEVVSRWLEWTGLQHRADYGPMLDRLAGERRAEPLRVLADACEATGLGTGRGRGAGPRPGTLAPLNHLTDAARPESESVRALEAAAARLVKNPADAGDAGLLRRQFTGWAANDARFQPLAEGNALLQEARPLSRDLSALGEAGLRLLDALAGGASLPADWRAHESAELTRMERPQAEVRLAAVRPIRLLLK